MWVPLEASSTWHRQRDLLHPHPLDLLQPLLILSQFGHECLVPEPSLMQLVAVFPHSLLPSPSAPPQLTGSALTDVSLLPAPHSHFVPVSSSLLHMPRVPSPAKPDALTALLLVSPHRLAPAPISPSPGAKKTNYGPGNGCRSYTTNSGCSTSSEIATSWMAGSMRRC